MKRYYIPTTNVVSVKYHYEGDVSGYMIYKMSIAPDKNTVHAVYTLDNAVKCMNNATTNIHHWDIQYSSESICNQISAYYTLNSYLYLNRNQFSSRLRIPK